jgi:hypothetical protein
MRSGLFLNYLREDVFWVWDFKDFMGETFIIKEGRNAIDILHESPYTSSFKKGVLMKLPTAPTNRDLRQTAGHSGEGE